MKTKQTTDKVNGIGDAAVAAKTGKTWAEWLAILDAAGATKMNHQQIAAYLAEQHQMPGWWTQMVTVGYEQERGLRQRHEKPDGYEISVSKTINVPVPLLFNAWQDETARARWFPRHKLTVRKATPDKSLRLTWSDGKSNVDVNFYVKGATKSQVTCQHSKLANPDEVEKLRAFWAKALQSLKETLES